MAEIVDFPQVNFTYRGNGADIADLPCYVDENFTISCYRFSEEERKRIAETGILWVGQMNFQQPLQPQAVWIEDPFRPVVPEEGER